MKQKTIPVLLLTGYLGSGKTTLVNHILTNERGIRFAVIVNDIGEVNIDASLIQKGGIVDTKDDSLMALQNGCICCTLKMDLVKQICDIIATDRFDYIVIEASGICEPAPIAQTICSMQAMDQVQMLPALPMLDCICTVVDALRLRDEFACGEQLNRKDIDEEDIENLIIQQIEFCNLILLNKVSEVSADELKHIRAIVRALQPSAKIVECDYADVPLDTIINTHLFDFEKVATSATWVRELEGITSDDTDEEHDEDGLGHHHEDHDHEHHHEHDHDEHEHHHDHDHDEHEHHHDHEHDHDHDEHEHHHDHDDHEHHHSHDDHEHHDHHHGHEHGGHDHHHHHADEIFTSWGMETPAVYTKTEIEHILAELDQDEKYGIVLRAKGMVPSTDGGWIYFDYVPEESNVRDGKPDVIGKFCVIGSKLKEDKLAELFKK